MKLTSISNTDSESTSEFEIKDRAPHESKAMKEAGYMELDRFKISNQLRTDGYFCGACKHWRNQPFTMPVDASDHDGYCQKFKFRACDYATCNAFSPKSGLFNYNPS